MASGETGKPAFRLTSESGGPIDLYPGREYVLGRGLSAQVRVSETTVSSQHASLRVSTDAILIKDLESANGTRLNGVRLPDFVAHDGDTVGFGRASYKVETVSEAAPKTPGPKGPGDTAPYVERSVASGLTMVNASAELLQDPRAAKLTLLLEVSQDLSRPLGVDEVLDRTCDRMLKLTNVDRVAIVTVEGDALELKTKIAATRRGREPDFTLPRSLAYTVIADLSPLRIEREQGSADIRVASLMTRGIWSAMCAPLLDEKGGLLGLLYVDSSAPGRSFTDDDLDLLKSFAGLVTSALRSSELVQALRREAGALERLRARIGPNLGDEFFADGIALRGGEPREVVVVEARLLGADRAGTGAESSATAALTEFFGAVAEVVLDYGGTLDRLQADRIVCNWGATYTRSDNPDRAFAAARDMLRSWNGDDGSPRHGMAIGIGMASGKALVHSAMVDGRVWLTLVGEAVTTATRLALRARASEILVSTALYGQMSTRPAGSRVPFARPPAIRVKHADARVAAS
jgi:class 3 adenylate cyclase